MEHANKLIDEWKMGGEYGSLQYIRVTMPPGDWTAAADRPIATKDTYPFIKSESGPAHCTDDQTRRLEAFVSYYIHQVNAIRFLLGEPYRLTYSDRKGILLTGESDGGATVMLEIAPYSTTVEWHETILVAFGKAFVKIDLPAPLVRQQAGKLTMMTDNGVGTPMVCHPVMPNESAMRRQAINFLAAVRGDRPAPCTAEEELDDLAFARDYIDYRIRHCA